MGLNFAVSLADGKAQAAQTIPDGRRLVERMFTTFDKVTGETKAMEIRVINCALQTASEQNIKPFDLAGKIPVYLAYKAAVNDFTGPSKSRDFCVIGKRPGKNGSGGIMVAVDELPEFVENVKALSDALNELLPELRQKAGLPSIGVRVAQPAAKAAGPVRVNLDDDGQPEE